LPRRINSRSRSPRCFTHSKQRIRYANFAYAWSAKPWSSSKRRSDADDTERRRNISFCYFEHGPDVFEYVEAGRAARNKYLKLKTFDVETERVD
jgi:hypothetical protein